MDQITRKFINRSLQNFQTRQFTSLSLHNQQRNGLMEPLKVWIVSLLEKKSRALLLEVCVCVGGGGELDIQTLQTNIFFS